MYTKALPITRSHFITSLLLPLWVWIWVYSISTSGTTSEVYMGYNFIVTSLFFFGSASFINLRIFNAFFVWIDSSCELNYEFTFTLCRVEKESFLITWLKESLDFLRLADFDELLYSFSVCRGDDGIFTSRSCTGSWWQIAPLLFILLWCGCSCIGDTRNNNAVLATWSHLVFIVFLLFIVD